MRGDDFLEDVIERTGDAPVRIVGTEFRKIRDVADVIALAVFVHVLPIEFLPGHLMEAIDGFDHGDAVFAAAAHVVDLAGAGIFGESFHGRDDIVAMDIVANLLGFVAEDGVFAAGKSGFDEVGRKP